MHGSEIKIKGQRFVLIPKKEFDALSRRTAKKSTPSSARRNVVRRRKAMALLDQWESSPATVDDAQWDVLQADIAANRFHLRPPVDD
jgi:hypothetical protein